jgi:perosamine synthetase
MPDWALQSLITYRKGSNVVADDQKISKYLGNELEYVKQVLQSEARSATTGNWNHRLEAKFSQIFGSNYAIAQSSGTAALHACLAAAGVRPGDEVISPALTVIMDAFATLYLGAVPVFADIREDTFNIDPESVRRRLTPRTKAIITVSLYGLPADMDPIMDLGAENNLVVIEDNAQCMLGRYKDRWAGTIGDMSIFSFENSKHISVGEGGMVITDDKELAVRVRKIAGIGYKNLTSDGGQIKLNEEVFQDPDYKRHDRVGWNYRLTELCAAVGVAQMERVEEIVQRHQAIGRMYAEALAGCDWLIPQAVPGGYTHTYWCFAVKYEGLAARGVPWKEFYRKYRELGGDGFYAAWSVPYEEPALQSLGHAWERCPVAEEVQSKVMQFKANYRDLDLAHTKADALAKTIKHFQG